MTDLGNVPAARVRSDPAPGAATVEDVVRLHYNERRLYELVDGTLVEKAIGWQESLLTGFLLQWLNNYLDQHRTPQDATVLSEGQILEAGNVLPGWQVDIGELFSRLNRNAEFESHQQSRKWWKLVWYVKSNEIDLSRNFLNRS